jgi:hypothetical protein
MSNIERRVQELWAAITTPAGPTCEHEAIAAPTALPHVGTHSANIEDRATTRNSVGGRRQL